MEHGSILKRTAEESRAWAAGGVLLFRGWQAVPAAVLIVYLVGGLFAPSSIPMRDFPGSYTFGRDTVESILFISSRIGRFAIPATAIGVAVGCGVAWALSRTPRYVTYPAYAVLVVSGLPTIALAFSAEVYLEFDLPFTSGEYAYGVLILTTVAATGAFWILVLGYYRDVADRYWAWVGLCFFAGLSLTVLAIWQAPEVYGFETGDVSPFFHCHWYRLDTQYPEWDCRVGDNEFLMQWYVWLPPMAILALLASSILMAVWSALLLRQPSAHTVVFVDVTESALSCPFPVANYTDGPVLTCRCRLRLASRTRGTGGGAGAVPYLGRPSPRGTGSSGMSSIGWSRLRSRRVR